MNKQVIFNIKVTMNERWVDDFCSMLEAMDRNGRIGHSSMVGFYADGDGDFRPKFEFDRKFSLKNGRKDTEGRKMEVFFDAE